MIKLKSRQETDAWLACLQASASAHGLAAEITPLAGLADSLYIELLAKMDRATVGECTFGHGGVEPSGVPNRGCYANAGGELEWVDRLGAVTTCRLMASGGDE